MNPFAGSFCFHDHEAQPELSIKHFSRELQHGSLRAVIHRVSLLLRWKYWWIWKMISQTNVYSWVYVSQRLQFTSWNLKMSECYRKQFQLNNIRTSCIFLSRRSRIVITNLFKKILLRKSASMKVCFYIMEKL